MSDLQLRPPKWRRSARFILSSKGLLAEAGYRSGITSARSEGGRATFEAARTVWATALGLQPEDGVCLVELSAGPQSLADLVQTLDDYGQIRADVLATLARLADGGYVQTPEPT